MASDGTKSQTLLWGDYLVIVLYFLFVLLVGLWVTQVKMYEVHVNSTSTPTRHLGNQNEAALVDISWHREAWTSCWSVWRVLISWSCCHQGWGFIIREQHWIRTFHWPRWYGGGLGHRYFWLRAECESSGQIYWDLWSHYHQAIFYLIFLGWSFVPVYMASGVFTMPEYLRARTGQYLVENLEEI